MHYFASDVQKGGDEPKPLLRLEDRAGMCNFLHIDQLEFYLRWKLRVHGSAVSDKSRKTIFGGHLGAARRVSWGAV